MHAPILLRAAGQGILDARSEERTSRAASTREGQPGDSLRAAEQALGAGKVVVIYPEGTITRDPERWPMPARTGVARLALHNEVPVVPVAHWGTDRVYDHYGGWLRLLPRVDVVVRAGEPVDLAEFRRHPVDRRLLHEVTGRIMSQVRDLLAEVRREQAPAEFFAPFGPGQNREQEL